MACLSTPTQLAMDVQYSSREYSKHIDEGRHVKLNDMKEEALVSKENKYIYRYYIPNYPRPEFRVSYLKHDTNQSGLRGIRNDGGFRNPYGESLVWWSLDVRPEEVIDAEERLLDQTYPGRAMEQESFLYKFTTSPSFLETSRMGSFRFTFSVEDVLQAYSQQVCSGSQAILRVYKTEVYKQEVMYVVLVHGPAQEDLYARYPLLTDDPNAVCVFRDGKFIWRAEAMSETHSYELIQRDEKMEAREVSGNRVQFYVWDHVAVVLHMERDQVLEFDVGKLRENLKFTAPGKPTINEDPFLSFEEAETLVKDLWPEHDIPLEKSRPLQEHFQSKTEGKALGQIFED